MVVKPIFPLTSGEVALESEESDKGGVMGYSISESLSS